MSNATLAELEEKALGIKKLYDLLNAEAGNKKWDVTDFMSGFVGDVGDLSKLIMAKQGLRSINEVDEKVAHELADCLWSILVLARELDIDLSAAFDKTMSELTDKLNMKVPK